MSKLILLGLAALVAAPGARAQDAIRLRNRAFRPAETMPRAELPRERSHYILQFRGFPGPTLRAELAKRGVRVLGYVPDSALMVSGEGALNLEGMDLEWSGPLDPADKISPALATGTTAAYLVFFHPDVDVSDAREMVLALGFDILENPYLLAGQLLVTGDVGGVPELAALDAVAYILPASADLVSGSPVMGCAGPLTEAGPIAEYVAAGPGWPQDASGNVALQYFFESVTEKLDAATVESEIERAFREWEKYANITLSAGTQATAARTIAILFARGPHGDAYPFDGPGGVLAHTFYPVPTNSEPIAGDMHFDDDEDWHVGADTDVFTVALHETGHALGLGHSSTPGAVMYPYYRFASGLTDDDIAGIRALYGAAGSATPVTPPTQPAQPAQPPAQPPASPPVVDNTPPSLSITSPGASISSTSSAAIHMTGTANDNVGVTSVKWSTSNGDAGTASGTTGWSADVPLLVGTTVVTVRAYDAAGNSGWRSVSVVRH